MASLGLLVICAGGITVVGVAAAVYFFLRDREK